MRKKILVFLITAIHCICCEQIKPRNPLNYDKINFLNQSVDRNIKINKKEEIYFLKIIEKDSKSRYFLSTKGFWFKIIDTSKKKIKPKSGDEVEFIYNILDLKGNDIYKDDNLKPIKYVIDKEEVIPALRYGIKELKVKESGIFLMPSFLCYGYQGDGEKISPNQPLIVFINLISLK